MMYLVSQMVIYLIGVGLLGLFVGWLLARNASDRRELTLRSEWESHMSGVRKIQTEMSRKQQTAEEQVALQVTEIEALRIRLEDTERMNVTGLTNLETLRQAQAVDQVQLEQLSSALSKASNINNRLEEQLTLARNELLQNAPPASDEPHSQSTVASLQSRIVDLEKLLESRDSDLAQMAAFNNDLDLKLTESQSNQMGQNSDANADSPASLRTQILERDIQLEALTNAAANCEAQLANAEASLARVQAERDQLAGLPDQINRLKVNLADCQAALLDAQGRPSTLMATPPDSIDDLKRISGIGKKLEKRLNEVGIYQFQQLAQLDAREALWLDDQLDSMKGRVSRDNWVRQARDIVEASK